MKIIERIKEASKILTRKKENLAEVSVGIKIKRCDECPKKIKCKNCIYKKAYEKQTPKKPKIKEKDWGEIRKYEACPICGFKVTNNFCPECGQALDWSKEE